MDTIIHNATIVAEDNIYHNAWLHIKKGKIADFNATEVPSIEANFVDAKGDWLLPGFIDVHVHGVLGVDVMDGTPQALNTMSQAFVKHGVTSFLPTTLTASHQDILQALKNVKATMQVQNTDKPSGADILGAHLEGPYLNPDKSGAQNLSHIRRATPDETHAILATGILRIVSLAPEYQENHHLIEKCIQDGITVSIAHTNATYEQAQKAIALGITHSTHTYNAMTGLHHREPGVLGAVLSEKQVRCEMICDNIHVHPAAQNVLWQAKGKHNTILITDAMRAASMPEGQYTLGDYDVTVQAGQAQLADGTLAGSILRFNDGVRNFMQNTNTTLPEIWQSTSLNAAYAANVAQQKGSIAPNKDADLVLVTDDVQVMKTWVRGELVYTR
jgi:N-acetylglucosamine-6-phosphate deacetylase